MTEKADRLNGIKAVIFDFDGTLAVLNIDFGSMRERIFDLVRSFGVREELIRQKHALEIIDEVSSITRLCRRPYCRSGGGYRGYPRAFQRGDRSGW